MRNTKLFSNARNCHIWAFTRVLKVVCANQLESTLVEFNEDVNRNGFLRKWGFFSDYLGTPTFYRLRMQFIFFLRNACTSFIKRLFFLYRFAILLTIYVIIELSHRYRINVWKIIFKFNLHLQSAYSSTKTRTGQWLENHPVRYLIIAKQFDNEIYVFFVFSK